MSRTLVWTLDAGRRIGSVTMVAELTPLRAVFIEDNPDDADLMARELRHAGFEIEWQRVEREADFVASLDDAPQIFLCDNGLPEFDAFRALEILDERDHPAPLVIVSGTIGEDVAVEAMSVCSTTNSCGIVPALVTVKVTDPAATVVAEGVIAHCSSVTSTPPTPAAGADELATAGADELVDASDPEHPAAISSIPIGITTVHLPSILIPSYSPRGTCTSSVRQVVDARAGRTAPSSRAGRHPP
jgi:CheY-like chemotaxis protein